MYTIKSMVSTALKLDADERYSEAYSKYLQSIKSIVESLYTDFNGYAVSSESTKLLRLGQQCMERMADLVNNLQTYTSRYDERSPITSPVTPTTTAVNNPFIPTRDVVTSPLTSTSSANAAQVTSPVIPTTDFMSSRQTTESQEPRVNSGRMSVKSDRMSARQVNKQLVGGNTGDLTPLEVAQRLNQRLLVAYRARMSNTTVNKGQAATLSLTLQRRLAENMAVAKAREQTLLRKQEERHKRLQEEAARSLQSTVGMSHDELERRQLYCNVLQYEQHSKKLLSWRERLKSHPDNTELSQTLLAYVFSQQEHPLTQILLKYQYIAYNKLYPLIQQYLQRTRSHKDSDTQRTRSHNDSTNKAISSGDAETNNNNTDTTLSLDLEQTTASSQSSISNTTQMSLTSTSSRPSSLDTKSESSHDPSQSIKTESPVFEMLSPHDNKSLDPVDIETMEKEALQRHLGNIVDEVHQYLEKIRTMVVVTYEDLDTVEGRDVCYSCIEERFFKPVWPYIIALYRIAYKDKEDTLSSVMYTYRDCVPSDIGVGEKYTLMEPVPTTYNHPYEAATIQLMSVVECTSPLTKLESIVKASRMICRCLEEHFNNIGSTHTANIGADDLLPILSYVILKSKRAELLAEAYALEEFIYEGYLMGEEGYCLTTLQTALSYIITLNTTDIEQ